MKRSARTRRDSDGYSNPSSVVSISESACMNSIHTGTRSRSCPALLKHLELAGMADMNMAQHPQSPVWMSPFGM